MWTFPRNCRLEFLRQPRGTPLLPLLLFLVAFLHYHIQLTAVSSLAQYVAVDMLTFFVFEVTRVAKECRSSAHTVWTFGLGQGLAVCLAITRAT